MTMENTQNHIIRCNRLLFIITMFLCGFYLLNVVLYYIILGDFYGYLIIVSSTVMVLLTIAYRRYKESTKALYVLSGLFYIAYCYTLVLFVDACYYSYMFAIIFVGVLYSNFKYILISTAFTEIAVLGNVYYKVRVLHVVHLVEFIYMPLMILIMLVIYLIGNLLMKKFMVESQNEVVKISDKNKQTASEVVLTVSQINEKFSRIMNDLKQINQQAENNNVSMRAIANSTEETVNEINHQAAMTSDIQNTINVTMDNVEVVHKTTEEVLGIIKSGVSMAEELNMQSQRVNSDTKQMSETIQVLVERVGNVSEITKAIMSISEQTNLLALNASIEAARAGDAGKGFAVVADEIRNLSDETKTSTQQIADIIHELSQVTDNIKYILNESVVNVSKQNQKVSDVNKGFCDSGERMNNLKVLIDGIVKDIYKITNANSKIVSSINQLSASTEEISGCSQESSSSSELISESIEVFTGDIEGIYEELESLSNRMS